jgi:hypothetical protein
MRLLSYGLIAALLSATGSISAAQAAAPNLSQGVSAYLQQMVPMRDKVLLGATVWRPTDQAQPLPAVLQFTPYLTDETHDRAVKFVKGGYVFVSADVRGRGDSGGVYRPQFGSGEDGADLVEWIAKQPWCDGRVVMIGGSYRGMVQWRTLAQHPKHLAAIVPTAPPYPGYDEPNTKGVFTSYMVSWLAYTSGHAHHDRLFGDFDYWESQYVHNYKTGSAFAALDVLAGTGGPVLDEWLQHHAYDSYWAAYNPDPKEYATVNIPILTITGYFDGDQPGALRYYNEFMQNASAQAKARLYLLMGPWDHPGTRYPQKQLGGLSVGDNSVLDIDQLQIDWFNWVLKGGQRPDVLSGRVNYYAMGEGSGEWRHTDRLEALADHPLKLYLSSVEDGANGISHPGHLQEGQPQDRDTDQFQSDPRRREVAGGVGVWGDNFVTDTRIALGKDSLIYQSEPLKQPLELAGKPLLSANISLDTPDADVYAELQALFPDGHAMILGYDFVRARFRRGMSREIPVTPGEVEPYVFDGFYVIDQRLPAGTRLRLVLAPLDTPDVEMNDNTGGPLGVKPLADGRVATISVHLDAAHPSYLELPLAKD